MSANDPKQTSTLVYSMPRLKSCDGEADILDGVPLDPPRRGAF